MARPASFLPAIKCSSCGVEIPIDNLADHVCAPSGGAAKQYKNASERPASPFHSLKKKTSGFLKPGRMAPPARIDAAAANKAYTTQPLFSPGSTRRDVRNVSPLTPKGRNPLIRSKTAPVGQPWNAPPPPSPEMPLPQETAFPPFISSSTPTLKKAQTFREPIVHRPLTPENRMDLAPISPRTNGGASVVKRMNTIAPGPFDGRKSSVGQKEMESFDRPVMEPTGEGKEDGSKEKDSARNSSGSSESRNSIMSWRRSRESLEVISPFGKTSPTLSTRSATPPARPPRSDEIDKFLEEMQHFGIEPQRHLEDRAATFPLTQSNQENSHKPADAPGHARRPSEPSSTYSSRASAATITSQSAEFVNGTPDERNFAQWTTSPRVDPRFGNAPPVPLAPWKQAQLEGTLTHSPSGSSASEGSNFGSDITSASSVSSAPTSSLGISRRPSESKEEYQMKPDAAAVPPAPSNPFSNHESLLLSPSPVSTPKESSVSPEDPLQKPRALFSAMEPPESPMDPAIQRGIFNRNLLTAEKRQPEKAPEANPSQERRPSNTAQNGLEAPVKNAMLQAQNPAGATDNDSKVGRSFLDTTISRGNSPEPKSSSLEPQRSSPEKRPDTPHQVSELTAEGAPKQTQSPSRRQRPSKGNCRGCEKPITGKSVKAADGRLTGRYHKECFVCKTCQSPFQTADFYVIDNHPYCERHYHQLNGSLCKSCDRGIEGLYLETDHKQKFHPGCFTCTTCRTPLRDDYFEIAGKQYCERHARYTARQHDSLTPGGARRHPERRTTRLMMMS